MIALSNHTSSESLRSKKSMKIAPPGTPYLTKIDGKLVMARDKRLRRASVAVNLLGDRFGNPTGHQKIKVHRRSSSVAPLLTPLIIDGIPYVPHPQYIQTAPPTQQAFPQYAVTPQAAQSSPFTFPAPQPAPEPAPEPPSPTQKDYDNLLKIDAHYNTNFAPEFKRQSSVATSDRKGLTSTSKTTITITKHICAQCGRVRSSKYHHENPIKPGEEPIPGYCRKCQRDASVTSGSDDNRSRRKPKEKSKKRREYCNSSLSDDEMPNPSKGHWRKRSVSEQPRMKTDFKENFYYPESPHSRSMEEAIRKGSYVKLRPKEYIFEVDQRRLRGRSRRRRFDEDGRAWSPTMEHTDSEYHETARPQQASDRYSSRPVFRHVPAPQYVFPTIKQESFHSSRNQSADPPFDTTRQSNRHNESLRQFDEARSSASRGTKSSKRGYGEHRYDGKEPNFESESQDSFGSSHARRQFQAKDTSKYWKEPKIYYPEHEDEEIVVIEERPSRPRSRGRRENKKTFGDRQQNILFDAQEDAANYYNNDWNKKFDEEPEPRPRSSNCGFRRDMYDPELDHSDDAYDNSWHGEWPQAPSPPLSAEPPYQINSRRHKKEHAEIYSPNDHQHSSRNMSRSRHTREEAVISSGTHSCSPFRERFYFTQNDRARDSPDIHWGSGGWKEDDRPWMKKKAEAEERQKKKWAEQGYTGKLNRMPSLDADFFASFDGS